MLLRWLEEAEPDVVCLQELKCPDERFPEAALAALGYGAIWHGQKSWNGVAILTRGGTPLETRRGLPGDPGDSQSRYIEAAVDGLLVGCLYLPNGNPRPGPKFDYKLQWTERFAALAARACGDRRARRPRRRLQRHPDRTSMSTRPSAGSTTRCSRPRRSEAYAQLLAQGWTDALRKLHPDEHCYTFWKYWRNSFARDAGLRIDHLLLNSKAAKRLRRGRGRPDAARLGQDQRPRAGVDRAVMRPAELAHLAGGR